MHRNPPSDPPGRPPRGPRPSGNPWNRPGHEGATHPHKRQPVHPREQHGHDEFQSGHEGGASLREQRSVELRLYGLNAVHAVFARRPQAIRKLYLSESRIPALQPLLKWCVANRVGYRVVEEADLHKLAASTHHEGVVADVLREEPQALSTWLRDLPAGPQCALWLDGVGNPHNLGAILRSAAHFGVCAVLLPKHSALALSGAAARVAEGGAEAVPMVRLGRSDNAIAQLRGAGFVLAATVVKGGSDLFDTELPERVVYVMGAEGEGMDRDLAATCDLQLSIPGTGAVESLNVAAATAVLLSAWRAASQAWN
jgi:TrmH RNA methyltransferase